MAAARSSSSAFADVCSSLNETCKS
uniref:Uncharacterized protein n=1 Tax=Oryza punctata TaxID=4537 RepID=A0A0E0KVC9_ORYPU